MFKQHLKDKVVNDLKELEEFITESTKSLNQEATNEDSVTLLKILKTLSSIHEREHRTDNMFEPLKEIVDLLRSYEMTFEDHINDQFAELPERWITLKKLAVFVKQAIGPVQAYQVDLIKKRISLFDLRTKLYHENFMRSPFFRVPCSNVYHLCDRVNNDLRDMEAQIVGLRESAVHFQLNAPEEGKLIQCRRLVKMVKQIWDYLYAVASCIDDWKRTPWKKINVEDMETECKKFTKDMRNFDKEMKVLKPYLETEAMIKNLLTSLRAITELQNPAIRERHWIELMVATKVGILSVSFHSSSIVSITQSLDSFLPYKKKNMRNFSFS
jgi:dynein heavy chain